MIVFNLHCANDHRFEGWFAGHDAFDKQRESSLIECPMCGSKQIAKLLSAPRINRGAVASGSASGMHADGGLGDKALTQHAAAALSPQLQAQVMALQAAWMQMARYIVENTEDVGREFAEEARRMHYQEAPERSIRGQASQEEAQALAEEGIEVLSLPLPAALKGPVQ
jgi:hypothetical protein